MKWFFGLLLCCTLCSCGVGSGNHEAIDAVGTSVNALEQSLPKECKTKGIQTQIDGIKKQLVVAESRCDDEIRKEKSNTIKWKTAFFGLLLVVSVWLLKKLKGL